MLSRTIGLVGSAQGVAGSGAFESDDGGDVAGANFGNVFALVGLHTHDTADAFFFAG